MSETNPHGRGTARPVRQVGDPVLRTPTQPVTVFDDALQRLVDDMFASMYAARGVGLAANQIGVSKSIFVYDCASERDGEDAQVGVVINPVLLPRPLDSEIDEDNEGCLSVAGPYADLGRWDAAAVEGVDVTGAPVRVEGTGLMARCLQHETDHLKGMLYIDHLDKGTREAVLAEWEKSQAEKPVTVSPLGL